MKEALELIFDAEPLAFSSDLTKNDNYGGTLSRSVALYLLVLAENQHVANCKGHIIEHLTSVTAEGSAPSFDAVCYWSYCMLSAAVALAKATPELWSVLSADLHERLDLMMRSFSYLASFATSDDNNYNTGPGLSGNYNKNWNPNYRLANVPPILFASHYFGQENVNAMIRNFDESEYQRIIDGFKKYGWSRALATWRQPARVHVDGSVGTDSKTVLCHGGPTYALDFTHSYVSKKAGCGTGVSNGGRDYFYLAHPLTEPAEIIAELLSFNYSGGPVKSEHLYDINGDGVAERVAWIANGKRSPYEGRDGMMLEFASGNRSSTIYCAHDFILTTCLITAAKALGLCNVEKNTALWERIMVGNSDFLFKIDQGYMCYSTGSYGTAVEMHSEKDESSAYFASKSLWGEMQHDAQNPPQKASES